jgi:E-phenylitaconyl-CoA hydratase
MVAVRAHHLPWVEAVRFGETMRLVANNTADAAEGRAAARAKRRPTWQGK